MKLYQMHKGTVGCPYIPLGCGGRLLISRSKKPKQSSGGSIVKASDRSIFRPLPVAGLTSLPVSARGVTADANALLTEKLSRLNIRGRGAVQPRKKYISL
jgi:hypothetical protein